MIKFIKTDSMKVEVLKEQEKFLSSKDRIKNAIELDNVLAFDIFDDDLLMGFAMLKNFDEGCFFLWDFAIDYKYQNKGYGTNVLKELIIFMNHNYKMHTITTTYVYGNNIIKHIYEKIGFVETSIVDENNTHEVNMVYKI